MAAAAALALVALGSAGSPRAGAQSSFIKGQAQASGAVFAVVPQAGGATLPITVGLATAQFRSSTATAEASTIDLGLIGSVLTLSICGADPILTPDQLPTPLHADSTTETGAKDREVAGGGVGHAGYERTEVRSDAFGASDATPSVLELPGVLSVSGTAHAETELVPGAERRAHATAEIGSISLLGGLVQLAGLRWQADQITGPDGAPTTQAGSFSAGRVVVGGVALPSADPAQLTAAIDTINGVLGPLALTLVPPSTTVGADGSVVVSPLRLRISGGSTTSAFVLPLLANDSTDEGRRAVANALLFGGCKPGVKGTPLQQLGGGANTIADVLVAGVEGNGGISIELGGVRATSDARTSASAFGSFLGDASAPALADQGSALASGASPAPAAGGATTPVASGPAPVSSSNPFAQVVDGVKCITTHKRGSPGCSAGNGTLAAGLAALLAAGLVTVDAIRGRRRDSTLIEEIT